MGTEVQLKMFSPGYHFTKNVNEKGENRSKLLNCNNSNMRNRNQLSGFSRWSTTGIYFGCEKEELRQIILKQESIFRHQLHELHRVYKIQRDLMNEIISKDSSNSSTFQSSLLSSNDESKQQLHNFLSEFARSGKVATPEGAEIASKSKGSGTLIRQLFDLELPADRYTAKEQEVPPCSESGLRTEEMSASTSAGILGRSRERLQKINCSASLQESFHARGLLNNPKAVQLSSNGNSFSSQSLCGEIQGNQFGSTQVELWKILKPISLSSDRQSSERQTSRKFFEVEISQRNLSGSKLPLQGLPAGPSTSFMKSMQGPCIINGGLHFRGPQEGEVSYQMNTDSLLVNFHQFIGMNKTEVTMPHCLVQDSSLVTSTSVSERRTDEINGCPGNGNTLGSYLDKCHSVGGVRSFNSNLMDNSMTPNSDASSIKYRVEVEQSVVQNMNTSSSREFFDLNVCPTSNDEEAPFTLCSETSHIMPRRGETDLKVTVLETGESSREESAGGKQGSSVMLDNRSEEENNEPLRVAAETLVAISLICANEYQEQSFPDSLDDTNSKILQWFADITISSLPVSSETGPLNHAEHIPKGLDYFEFATLNLAEAKPDELSDTPPVWEELQEKFSAGRLQKFHGRRGRSKDFQRDILPSLTSLSRNEVTKDLQAIEGLIKDTGRAPRAGPQQKNSASKDSKARGRTKRRKFVDDYMIKHQAAQTPKCPELGIDERALSGWGKRARRPKRPRCSSAVHSVSLKEASIA